MSELEKKYEKLINTFYVDIQRSWYIYNYIFSSKENVENLNNYKNNLVFYLFQKMASDSIILGLNRLFDEYKKREDDTRQSLSLHYFKRKLPSETLRREIGNLISKVEKRFIKYKKHRDNKLGHSNTEYEKELYIGEDIEYIIKDIIVILERFKQEFKFEKIELYDSNLIMIKNKNIDEILDSFLNDITELGLK